MLRRIFVVDYIASEAGNRIFDNLVDVMTRANRRQMDAEGIEGSCTTRWCIYVCVLKFQLMLKFQFFLYSDSYIDLSGPELALHCWQLVGKINVYGTACWQTRYHFSVTIFNGLTGENEIRACNFRLSAR